MIEYLSSGGGLWFLGILEISFVLLGFF